ncbi:unnamed protein product [Arctogadus glacialis]
MRPRNSRPGGIMSRFAIVLLIFCGTRGEGSFSTQERGLSPIKSAWFGPACRTSGAQVIIDGKKDLGGI